jgi:hypothetical protein
MEQLSNVEMHKMLARSLRQSKSNLLEMPGINKDTAHCLLELPSDGVEISEEELGDCTRLQQRFLRYCVQAMTRTSFPWMNPELMKKMETLTKKLQFSFTKSYHFRRDLMANECSWDLRVGMTETITLLIKNNKIDGIWNWLDGFNTKPILDIGQPLDIDDGPILLNNQETLGNQSARLQSYLSLRQTNHIQLQKLIKVCMVPGLGLGIGDQAIPIALEGLKNFLQVSSCVLSYMFKLIIKITCQKFKIDTCNMLGRARATSTGSKGTL